MITVHLSDNSIVIEGHAEYAEHGKDIVCAAVSVILQTAQLGLMSIAEQYPNNVEVKHE